MPDYILHEAKKPPIAETVSAYAARAAIDVYVGHSEKMHVLAMLLCNRLADSCNEGGEPPDDAPIVEWRLAQLLEEGLSSTRTEESLRAFLKQESAHV